MGYLTRPSCDCLIALARETMKTQPKDTYFRKITYVPQVILGWLYVGAQNKPHLDSHWEEQLVADVKFCPLCGKEYEGGKKNE